MTPRTGRFGKFYVCNKHGTLSVSGTSVYCTGQIFRTIQDKMQQPAKKITPYYPCEKPVDLELVVRTKMASMGLWADELDLFIEGGPGIADTEPDHWMNLRPY